MKKLFLILGILLGANQLKASQVDWNIVPTSTYTTLDTGGVVLFSSAQIMLVGFQLSSGSTSGGNNFLTFYRSTSALFTTDLATQVSITIPPSAAPLVPIPLYEITNASYTYWQKAGTWGGTLFFRCINLSRGGVCPGLQFSGQK